MASAKTTNAVAPRKSSRIRPLTAIGAATMGVVTASVGIVPPAYATDYPSWNDVQQAKQNVAQQQAMITNITSLISGLQTQVSAAQVASEKAAEAYFQAKDALAAATAKVSDLNDQVSAAEAKAKTSQMRAGLLASHLAKTSGQDLSVTMMLNSKDPADANKLLYQLGEMSKLTEQSKGIYAAAVRDKNSAQALTQQATVAEADRSKLADAASAALDAAHTAQANAQSALASQQQKSTELVAQLASLQNTSATVEAGYLQGQAAAAAAAAAAKAAAEAAAAAAQANNGGGGAAASAPPANGNIVATAIAYAKAQLGKPYIFDGEGPVGYDCSGLTMKAFAYAGVYIGSHSVNDQWYTAASKGEIVSYSNREPGDLLFWGDGPGDFYHVGIYLGGGMMIAAPTEGENVKIQAVWGPPYGAVARVG